jgi:hypothetical protein
MGTWEISTKESAFRRCGYDMVHCFNTAVWAVYVQIAVPMRLPDAGRLVARDPPSIRKALSIT